jgi:hypothetical protein
MRGRLKFLGAMRNELSGEGGDITRVGLQAVYPEWESYPEIVDQISTRHGQSITLLILNGL